ncbi:hypothetical protein ANANSI_83 [Arthrobacter phage Anansi]|uniref:Uncharacterized protein n=3 Tax=Amigovirus amigo TaxID=1982100 RepID=A0A0U4JEC0_9CAUD|nr:hypothetical protein ANANSI_83 [Arthrobacter phage Anansi]ALY09140.1 hypothetical protein GORGEOUS_83 [Arthrobacter phage Gorgeous]ALY10421.1 hypothetical protein SORJUANA_83 [Arthrobacter phage SorJuana]
MTDTMTITELHSHVERKFTGGYRCQAVLTAWDVTTETATYLLHFHAAGRYVAKLDTTIYAQAVQAASGMRGAATYSHKPTAKHTYQISVTTEDD